MIGHALEYISKGFPVIPLCWPVYGACGCGRNHQENNIGKVPLTTHGLKNATITRLGVRDYWRKYPKANIGIVIPNGYFVLDLDVMHDGFESVGKLQERYGALTKTWLVCTGTGGQHYWYKTPKEIKNTTRLAGLDGLDIRGIGGYVVAPPSIHRCGGIYEVSPVWNDEITTAPAWLINLCFKPQPEKIVTGDVVFSQGARNDTLARIAGSMRRKGLSEEAILAALEVANQHQCSPPLTDNEVRLIAKSIGRYSPAAPPTYNGNLYQPYNGKRYNTYQ